MTGDDLQDVKLLEERLAALRGRNARQRSQLLESLILRADLDDAVRWFAELRELSDVAMARCLDAGSVVCVRLTRADRLAEARSVSNWLLRQQAPGRYSGDLHLLEAYAAPRKRIDRDLRDEIEARLQRACERFGIKLDASTAKLPLRDRILAAREAYGAGARRWQSLIVYELPAAGAARRECLREYTKKEPIGFFRRHAREWLR